jgi:protein transport protein SEC23
MFSFPLLFLLSSIDLAAKLWICPFCLQRNNFPPFYSEMTPNSLPAEIIPNFTTLEYQLPRAPCPPPIFLFVVDTCMDEDELQSVKETLILSLSLLPQDAMVGLITFGPTVSVVHLPFSFRSILFFLLANMHHLHQIHIYELAFPHCPKSYVFNGSKELSSKQIQGLLGITAANPAAGARSTQQQHSQPRFIVPRSECEQTLENILEELQRDPHPVKTDRRPLRSTGVALAVSISLLEAYVGYGARLMLFTGGPCTSGPGQVVGDELKEPIRSHTDLHKDHAKHVKKATKV